ncbi:serine/threonine-protein kinase [Paenibacillus allorhizosphaerae]|uniref:Protein kinase domain-containing protein n=1 Tax=Paenibacillus allorhizosphaerae TaxID=2849866 RepID=A0ABM8VIM7_9BACL|nr:serine/threonine-protein kinase [Paenibacillus allorhizosphaerae]CAG7644333.1 hypothetical protein PAECIP111802_03232 [Paenibacillus allorhizosphaerae]
MEKPVITMKWNDNVSFQLRQYHDFEWLRPFGNVFCVFDQQDSGNIGFGVERNGRKAFIKYAGAQTAHYSGEPADAVVRLKQAVPLYERLRHEHLVRLTDHFATEQGYAAVFEWFDGECLHAHWSFPPPAKHTHPDSPFYRYRQLTVERRLASLQAIFSFHAHVESQDMVAVDFYDGSILYDFTTHITRICDIDFYQPKPFVNSMGQLWGSSRFMSPEEFGLGAAIDARTNVFTMGATAFALVGGERDRSLAKWEAGSQLYEVAARAVQSNKNDRYATVAEFCSAWTDAAKV